MNADLIIRRAGVWDTGAMADLLNQIIAKGGTTALTDPVTADRLSEWMQAGGAQAVWHVAETDQGQVVGFQWVDPHPDLPDDACSIATFVQIGQTGLGIGSKLFDATQDAARNLGYRWISAVIRADNTGGLTYYQSRGFETHGQMPDVVLPDGQRVGKIMKRFDLR